jgi:hypothetical protein
VARQRVFGFARTYTSVLDDEHYLGSTGCRPRHVYEDEHGVIVFSSPVSRRLPSKWLELSRWCLVDGRGSQQWSSCVRWLRSNGVSATTVVSYADPSVGHTGALYRACGWVWAPTWHVLREPPTGAGIRSGKLQRAKHRYVYLLAEDAGRETLLQLTDESLARKYPWVGYREPDWRGGRPRVDPLASRFKRWSLLRERGG